MSTEATNESVSGLSSVVASFRNIAHPHAILDFTAGVVINYLEGSPDAVSAEGFPAFLKDTLVAVKSAFEPEAIVEPIVTVEAVAEPVELKPAVSIKKSITPDYLVCLEDGAKVKMLKRHIMSRFGLTPDEYRAKWGLPSDYPMVAPSYAKRRSELALSLGLGRKKVVVEDASAVAEAA